VAEFHASRPIWVTPFGLRTVQSKLGLPLLCKRSTEPRLAFRVVSPSNVNVPTEHTGLFQLPLAYTAAALAVGFVIADGVEEYGFA